MEVDKLKMMEAIHDSVQDLTEFGCDKDSAERMITRLKIAGWKPKEEHDETLDPVEMKVILSIALLDQMVEIMELDIGSIAAVLSTLQCPEIFIEALNLCPNVETMEVDEESMDAIGGQLQDIEMEKRAKQFEEDSK